MEEQGQPAASERRWALLYLILKFLKITGATASLVLVYQTGVNSVSVSATLITCLLVMTAVLFRNRPLKKRI